MVLVWPGAQVSFLLTLLLLFVPVVVRDDQRQYRNYWKKGHDRKQPDE